MKPLPSALSRSQGQLHWKYAVSLAGVAFTLAMMQQLLSGSVAEKGTISERGTFARGGAVDVMQTGRGGGIEENPELRIEAVKGGQGGQPAAVIYAEDGSVLAVQQTATSAPIVVRGAVGVLPGSTHQGESKAERKPQN